MLWETSFCNPARLQLLLEKFFFPQTKIQSKSQLLYASQSSKLFPITRPKFEIRLIYLQAIEEVVGNGVHELVVASHQPRSSISLQTHRLVCKDWIFRLRNFRGNGGKETCFRLRSRSKILRRDGWTPSASSVQKGATRETWELGFDLRVPSRSKSRDKALLKLNILSPLQKKSKRWRF